jgi:hypothetical protein
MQIPSIGDQGGNTPNGGKMNSKNMIKGAFLAFCIIGMMVLPAAAAPNGQGNDNGAQIDQGLKDDLWANHYQYRLSGFDTNVQRATGVIAILNTYNIDTTQPQSTLTIINGKRSALETALAGKDKEKLKTINAELKTLWEQFRTEIKESIRAHFTAARSGAKASAAGKTGAATVLF